MNDVKRELASELAKAITALCVRNTFLEDLHSGLIPASKAGDYSDVRVVTPCGEIPWQKLSRISDEEMKRLMKQMWIKSIRFYVDKTKWHSSRHSCNWATDMRRTGMNRS